MKLNFILIVVLAIALFSSCKKNHTDPQATQTITAVYYFKGTLNGQSLVWQVTDDSQGWVTGSSSSGSLFQGVYTGGLTALLSATPNLTPQLGVEFKTFNIDFSQDVSAYFNGFVKPGAWTYASDNFYNAGTKAIVIHYFDAKGTEYSSIGSQSGSSASVLAVTPVPAQLGRNESSKIKLTFNCNLYPVNGTGSALTLTNAEATVRLENLIGD